MKLVYKRKPDRSLIYRGIYSIEPLFGEVTIFDEQFYEVNNWKEHYKDQIIGTLHEIDLSNDTINM